MPYYYNLFYLTLILTMHFDCPSCICIDETSRHPKLSFFRSLIVDVMSSGNNESLSESNIQSKTKMLESANSAILESWQPLALSPPRMLSPEFFPCLRFHLSYYSSEKLQQREILVGELSSFFRLRCMNRGRQILSTGHFDQKKTFTLFAERCS